MGISPLRLLGTLLVATLSSVTTSAADDPGVVVAAANNAGHELIECAAYFSVVAHGMRNTPGEKMQEGASKYEAAAEDAVDLAIAISESIDQKPEAVIARMDMAMKDMIKAIDSNYINISILMSEYGDRCQTVMEDPTARIQWWIDKKSQ